MYTHAQTSVKITIKAAPFPLYGEHFDYMCIFQCWEYYSDKVDTTTRPYLV